MSRHLHLLGISRLIKKSFSVKVWICSVRYIHIIYDLMYYRIDLLFSSVTWLLYLDLQWLQNYRFLRISVIGVQFIFLWRLGFTVTDILCRPYEYCSVLISQSNKAGGLGLWCFTDDKQPCYVKQLGQWLCRIKHSVSHLLGKHSTTELQP